MMNPLIKNIKKLNSGFTRLNILLYHLLLILTFPIKNFSETNDEIDLEYLDKKIQLIIFLDLKILSISNYRTIFLNLQNQ